MRRKFCAAVSFCMFLLMMGILLVYRMLYAQESASDKIYMQESALDKLYMQESASDKLYARESVSDNLYMQEDSPDKLYNKKDGPDSLYALSAVLMDADTGRILYEKEGETARPMASTTKVMTCILALENAPGDDYVIVSANAASQPEVKLNMREGEQYYLEDLLYSLMLKSHNDTAVAIAEHIGGSVEGFAKMMNEKAEEIGCRDTHFVTPNGLDAEDEGGTHHTTAADLALIMRYAIRNQTFVNITQTRDYSFSDLSGKRQFSVHNANALLDMTEGVLSGKTGFTGDAGYCYVCACRRGEKTFIVSLLGCGWPGHKSYKWKDTLALLEYGDENFRYQTFWKEPVLKIRQVGNGVEKGLFPGTPVYLKGEYTVSDDEKNQKVLMKNGDEIRIRVSLPKKLEAPVNKGQTIGEVSYWLEKEELLRIPLTAEKSIDRISYLWCADRVFHDFFH